MTVLEHTWHECDEEHCMVCEGDLSMCIVCGQAEGTLEEDCPGPKIKKVKVRIAAAVDYEGHWSAIGWDVGSDNKDHNELLMGMAVENLAEDEVRYWVTAELEIPEKPSVKEIKVSKIEQEHTL